MTSKTRQRLAVPGLEQRGSEQARRLDIQGLRAIAVLSVVAFHADLPVPGGFLGVDVFFVISGFVITQMLMREHAVHQRIRFGRFYWRRFKRLTPALAVMVGITILASALVLSPLGSQQVAAKTGLGAMFLVANYVIAAVTGGYFAGPAEANPLLHTWSLSVEEQFYLVFPGVLGLGYLLSRRFSRMRWAPFVLVVLVGAASFGLLVAGLAGVSLPGVSVPPSFYSPLTRAWEFAAGALVVFVVSRPAGTWRSRLASPLGVAGLATLLASFWLLDDQMQFPGYQTLIPVLGTAAVLAAGSADTGLAAHWLSRAPLARVGDWSYSIYLWHWPLIVLAVALWPQTPYVALFAAVVSVAPALASFHWVEQPLRQLAVVRRRTVISIVLLTVAPPVALSAGLLVAANQGFWTGQAQALIARSATRFGEAEGCEGTVPALKPPASECVYNAEALGAPVYLLGDSYAGQFTDTVVAASRELGRPFIPRTSGGCPFADAFVRDEKTAAEYSPDCSLFNEETMSWLERSAPGAVVIANAEFYLRDPSIAVGRSSDRVSVEPGRKTSDYAAGLRTFVERAKAAGHSVVVVQPIPNFRLDSDEASLARWSGVTECPMIRVLTDSCQMSAPESLEAIQRRQQSAWDAGTSVANETGARVLDLAPQLCPDGMCPVQQGNTVMYNDYLHLTVDGAKRLAPTFASALRDSAQ